jgi:hypothetical protein
MGGELNKEREGDREVEGKRGRKRERVIERRKKRGGKREKQKKIPKEVERNPEIYLLLYLPHPDVVPEGLFREVS